MICFTGGKWLCYGNGVEYSITCIDCLMRITKKKYILEICHALCINNLKSISHKEQVSEAVKINRK